MSSPSLDELRADGRVVVDAADRRIAIHTNENEVVLLVGDGRRLHRIGLTMQDLQTFSTVLLRAANEAIAEVVATRAAAAVIERAREA